MTQRQIELVENTWDFILVNTSDAGTIFYGRLFELDPTLKNLFREDMRSQSQKLVSMITFVVHKLNRLNEVVADVKALGQRHRNYQVKPEHYTTVANALLWTLEQALGADWNEETKQAWITVYTVLSNTMIEASKA